MIKFLRTHRWVKLVLLFLTLKDLKSQRLYNHFHCLDCLTIIKNKHTHTHVYQSQISELYSKYNFSTLNKSELISDNVGTAQQ